VRYEIATVGISIVVIGATEQANDVSVKSAIPSLASHLISRFHRDRN
jgi:hypothetical protein